MRVLTTAGEKLNELSYTLYDVKGRAIRTYQKNHLGGYTQADTKLNFIGTAEYTITKHKRLNTDTEITVREDFIYSPQGRLREHNHKINSLTTETLSYNEYDELGQLKKKKVGRTSSTPLQEVDYLYNIRGWLTDINNVDNLGGDLFGFKISYENPLVPKFSNSYKALYNGNISETYWKSSSDNVLRKYGYSYDGLNRLNASLYMKPMTSQQRGMDLGSYNEHITYDKNGNINTLFRNGDLDSNLDVIEIDDLDYIYDGGNKLLKVMDNSNHPEGFKDGTNSGNDYSYDDFGNMIQDLNKGINSITYNHLNLPTKITYSSSSQNISYLYNALGVKVQKKVFKSGIVGTFNPDHTVTTDYLSGFHYEFNDNPNIASSGGLVFFATSEGYVNVTTNRSVSYNYVYNYTDHLGNVRVSYTSGTGGAATIMEENHYYPFGLKHKKYGSTVKDLVEVEDGEDYYVGIEIVPPGARKTYQYKYNGKEFQDELGLNFYDYGARNYDPALGRWMNIDPLAEVSRRWSPYNYAYNNPIYYVDPDGRENIPALLWAAQNMANKGIPFSTWYGGDGGWTYKAGVVPTGTVCYESCWTSYMNGADASAMTTLKSGFSTKGGGFKGRSHETGGMNWFKAGDGTDRKFVSDISKGELGDIVFMGEVGDMQGHAVLLASEITKSTIEVDGVSVETMTFYSLSTGSDSDAGNYGGREFTFSKQSDGSWKQVGGSGYTFRGYGQMTNVIATDEQRKETTKAIEEVKKGN